MILSKDEIAHVAELAKLALSEQEQTQYANELSVVFEYMKTLDEVDTEGVGETTQVTGLEDVVRDDVVVDCSLEVQKKLIDAFSQKDGRLLRVRAVFNEQ